MILVVGDIHGCYSELLELLEKASFSKDDQLISLGDFVDRGPDTVKVFDLIQSDIRVTSVMGNHERKHIRSYAGELGPSLSQKISRKQFGETKYPSVIDYMKTLPLHIELEQCVLVHGMFESGVLLEKQNPMILCGTMGGEKILSVKYKEIPWYKFYDGIKPLIFGHHNILRNGSPFIYKDKIFGLDTSCCHGGYLTGLILPEFRIIQVKSHKDYWSEIKKIKL